MSSLDDSQTLFFLATLSRKIVAYACYTYIPLRGYTFQRLFKQSRAVSYMIVACRYYAEQPYTSYCLVLLTNTPIDFHPPNFPHV